MSYSTESMALQIPLTRADRDTAARFAQQQSTSAKAAQVYRNTLSVLAMYHYCEMLDIPADLSTSHSWNSIDQLCSDVADLMITGVGRLECRTVQPGDRTCQIPPETWADRVGYVVIHLDPNGCQGTILGFTTTIEAEVAIHDLAPIDEWLVMLNDATTQTLSAPPPITIGQWLNGVFEKGWRSVESVLTPTMLTSAFAFRQTQGTELGRFLSFKQFVQRLCVGLTDQASEFKAIVDRATTLDELVPVLIHLIGTATDDETLWSAAEILWTIDSNYPRAGVRRILDLSLYLTGHQLVLIVAILPGADQAINVLAQIRPPENISYLPPDLELSGLDASGVTFLTAQSRSRDNYIQLKFTAEPEEEFSIRIAIEGSTITQNFVP
ncbi:DUF1822 family protein [Vacuolonema iberomarrocanum]|uniref:DUF1822 family protein n=1 Tax=Vacuolonema iberomarrocanum TaxID=3454632 RepID=UPI0019FFAB69|nr:DUF1822 family protein [filamentous cyanobacterium LEGE 07170]